MVAAAAAAAQGGPSVVSVEEGVGESSSPPREEAPVPSGSGGSGGGGGARDICGQVLERLVADGHAEASDPEFREKLVAHFGRLPHSYQLDINVDKAADVLVHQNVLAEAKDPDRRPAFHVKFLRIEDMDHAYDSDASDEGDDDGDELSVRQDTQYTHIHEVVFSTIDKPKLLSQLSALLSDIGLNIREAHVFSTLDGYSLDVFVVDGWPIEGSWSGSSHSSAAERTLPFQVKGGEWEIDKRLLKMGSLIASGSCGDLYHGTYLGEDVAVKVVKVADFGVARFQDQGGIMTAETGTYRWMAPEIPYDTMTPLQAAVGVRQGLRPGLPKKAHPKLLDLLQRCWEADPSKRPAFPDILAELEDLLAQVQGASGKTVQDPANDFSTKD
nr:unnamed protein product [Digitaria exilis]